MTPGADNVLSVEGLGVAFGHRRVLQDVSFRLGAGAFCGLIGPNGSGKTTLLRTILGLQRASEGRVHVARGGIGYVPQTLALDPYLPVRPRDLVALGLDGHRFGLLSRKTSRSRDVEAMLHAVGADGFADQRLGTLSGGQQRRVLIAHALVRRPRLLLLDEPLASLDLRSAGEIVTLLQRLATEHGVAVLLSAHDVNPLLRAMDRIVYFAAGRAASGVPEAVVRTEVLSRLYGYRIDVIRVHGRVLVVAAEDAGDAPEADGQHALHVSEIP